MNGSGVSMLTNRQIDNTLYIQIKCLSLLNTSIDSLSRDVFIDVGIKDISSATMNHPDERQIANGFFVNQGIFG